MCIDNLYLYIIYNIHMRIYILNAKKMILPVEFTLMVALVPFKYIINPMYRPYIVAIWRGDPFLRTKLDP